MASACFTSSEIIFYGWECPFFISTALTCLEFFFNMFTRSLIISLSADTDSIAGAWLQAPDDVAAWFYIDGLWLRPVTVVRDLEEVWSLSYPLWCVPCEFSKCWSHWTQFDLQWGWNNYKKEDIRLQSYFKLRRSWLEDKIKQENVRFKWRNAFQYFPVYFSIAY